MAIQIRLPLAAKSATRGFNIGSNRNDAKIKMAANVPSVAAVLPKRKATRRIKRRSPSGRTVLNELAWNNRVRHVAKTAHAKLPARTDFHGFTRQ